MRRNEGIFDGHLHAHATTGVSDYLRNTKDNLSASGIDGMNLLCVRPSRGASVSEAYALLAKALFPGKFTVFAMPSWKHGGFDESPEGIAEQVRRFKDGCIDGVKMSFGDLAPGMRLDDEWNDPMFDYLEEAQFPLLIHVGTSSYRPAKRKFQMIKDHVEGNHMPPYDPARMADEPEKFLDNEEKVEDARTQMLNMLDRHPRTPLILPHMFFLSDDLDRAAALLDKYPSMKLDFTPCNQIYYYMSQNVERSREFIINYKDRLIFGTDNLMEMDPIPKVEYMIRFFETDEPFFAPQWGFDVQGVYPLPVDVLANIYKNNFFDTVKRQEIVPARVIAYLEQLYDITKDFEELPEQNKKDVLEIIGEFKKM